MSEWKTISLCEVADVRDGTHDSPKQKNEGEYLITSRHIKNGKIDFTSTYKISLTDYEEVNRRSKVHKWDVLFSMIGTIGEMTIIDFEPNFAIKNIGLFKTAGNKDLAQWIYYFFKSNEAKAEIDASLKGSTQQYITLADLRNFPITFPPIPEQKAIAAVLSSLDNKIDLLHRQNKTLEAMAETLFRQWFVEEADEEWEEKPLSFFGKIICGKTPPKNVKQYFDGNVPFIKIPDMHENTFIFQTSDSLTEQGKLFQDNKTLPPKSICVSCIATVGLVSLNAIESQTNQQINSIIPNEEFFRYFLYLTMNASCDLLQAMASGGTATLNLNTGDFSNIPIVYPEVDELIKFDKIVKPLFEKVFHNQIQIHTLEKLRDTLLPKLMSGEVRVEV
ncbi:MAG: restriction endonuclease subunit S [Treponema sp.]|jgi:type I restriction enzyme S subunit|nr:restriction endonuclease subunit S [Treponema sp.]